MSFPETCSNFHSEGEIEVHFQTKQAQRLNITGVQRISPNLAKRFKAARDSKIRDDAPISGYALRLSGFIFYLYRHRSSQLEPSYFVLDDKSQESWEKHVQRFCFHTCRLFRLIKLRRLSEMVRKCCKAYRVHTVFTRTDSTAKQLRLWVLPSY